MEKKTVKKKAAPAKKPAKKAAANEITVDPFESFADTTSPVKSTADKKRAVKAKTEPATIEPKAAATSSPVRKAVKKPAAAKKRTTAAAKKEAKPSMAADILELPAAEAKTADSTVPEAELSPVFKKLAEPVLPELKRENRARLQMQTPTRLYFYWSVKDDPWTTLRDVFGDDLGSYTLVLKLNDLTNGTEVVHRCEAEGNWWFNVKPAAKYRAEVGFYAPNRPYFRIIYSNTVETPRRSPSPHRASEAQWTVSASKFAEVLGASGFRQDAFEVSAAGDDHYQGPDPAYMALASFADIGRYEMDGIPAEDIRYAMAAIASGATLEELRFRIGASMFAILQSRGDLFDADHAMGALGEYFDLDEAEFTTEHLGPAVFGASLIHFPKILRSRTRRAEYKPVSSHELRR